MAMATSRNPKLLLLAAAAVMALALFVLLPMGRDSNADAAVVSIPLTLAPAAAVADMDVAELEQWAASSPTLQATETSPSPANDQRLDAPATVVAATPAPTTIRRVVVTKGSRVVRNIPVAPPAASAESQPVPRAVRFNMSQDGKRMTADEFDAWMKAQGIRVATGPSKPAVPATPPAAPVVNCVPEKDAGC